jgi:hypothetical protein
MAQLYERHGPDYIINEADMKAVTAAAMRAARGGGGPGAFP